MKRFFLILTLFIFTLSSVCAQNPRLRWNVSSWDEVFDNDIYWSATSSTSTSYTLCSSSFTYSSRFDTLQSDMFSVESNTFGFLTEILYSDSVAFGDTYENDSIAIQGKIQWLSPNGQSDSTTYTDWTEVLCKSYDGGLVNFGEMQTKDTKTQYYGILHLIIGSGYNSANKAHIRVYKIEEYQE